MDVKNKPLPHFQGLLLFKQTGRWAMLAAGVFLSLTYVPWHNFLLPQIFKGEWASPHCTGGSSGEKGRAEGLCRETPLTSLPLALEWLKSVEKQGHCVESSTEPFAVRVRDWGHHLPLSSIYSTLIKFGLAQGRKLSILSKGCKEDVLTCMYRACSQDFPARLRIARHTSSPAEEGVCTARQWQLEAALQTCPSHCALQKG